MNNEVEKFDPSTLMQGVKDRIKSTFISLIPDAQWEQMVKAEIDLFFKQKEIGYSREYRSDFQILVRNVLEEKSKELLKVYLSSPEFEGIWQSSGIPIASEQVKKMFIENSGAILANMFGGMFQYQLDQFKMQLTTRQY